MRALIVEDDRAMADVTRMLLTSDGFDIELRAGHSRHHRGDL